MTEPKSASPQILRLILGDQLNASHSWLAEKDNSILYVMMEIGQETSYVRHHRQKVLVFFAAMRNFAKALTSKGHQVSYLTLDDKNNQQSLTKNLSRYLKQYPNARLQCQLPDEYRVDHQLRSWAGEQELTIEWFDSEHFLTQRDSLEQLFDSDSKLLMETFYRHMRRHLGVLMDGDSPIGGQWNFDSKNRKKLPKKLAVSEPLIFKNDAEDIDIMLTEMKVDTIGNADPRQLSWPTSRHQARQLLSYFCEYLLPYFGTYQDAMTSPEHHQHYWSLFHSRLSFALNSKMLAPLEVVDQAVASWQRNPDSIELNQIEGFVRQIIGWREYIRGIYWRFMPEYKNQNQLHHQRSLPAFYWNAKTNMNCVRQSVQQSLDYAYAHHIQRLMVTGNFALLAGVDPDQVDDWYLGIYIDALEWVELPNTRGMSQYADGGLLATKPYVSSANYIQKMSHYCSNCHYRHDQKTGDKACPFNSLYWHFIDRNQQQFKTNHRMGMMYSVWHKKSQQEREQLLEQANYYLDHLDDL
ncbi:cryptochrome/photolyase family protein [Idiomarina seosinensis]|uniref:Cryptochrome/photolyase family protein n=1 Tax=Idiomarina seosinensis TaxID=281739 RepID=A0A432Z4B9_9GAMM|nr:cryptochrome/photolyase family protein [Idiomarina seosinensis]RUO72758.1 cryptochrome/photolyase family protein [Idiomarina seosinensis]